MSKDNNPIKNKGKTLLQQNPLPNETALYEDDDPVIKRNPQQKLQLPQSPPIFHTLLSVIQYQNFCDSHLSQDILTNWTNSLTQKVDPSSTSPDFNAITQTPKKPTSTQSLPFSTPPFSLMVKRLKFFLPSNTLLAFPIFLEAKQDDHVLSTIYEWVNQKQTFHLSPIFEANRFLNTYYRQFQYLYLDPNSHLLQYYTPNSKKFEKVVFI